MKSTELKIYPERVMTLEGVFKKRSHLFTNCILDFSQEYLLIKQAEDQVVPSSTLHSVKLDFSLAIAPRPPQLL
jgi:hypothetical protein